MPNAAANGIRIQYETIGDPAARPLLLIGGLATQLIHWDDSLCDDLARRGHYVIRFDNRDAGLSSPCDGAGSLVERGPAYTIDDMADDAAGLLDAVGIGRAHILGTSMGGMIAQALAIRHPSRVQSLISVYSTTGNRDLPPPKPEVVKLLLAPAPRERDAYIEHMVVLFGAMAGRGFAFDEAWARMIAGRAYDRSFTPEGTARQVSAVMHQADRRRALASVAASALVIHGTDDPVIPVEAGRDTADALPKAQLLLVDGMGHDLPHGGAWPTIAAAVAAHTARVAG